MSDTPRTDAELQVVVVGDDYSGMVEFCRQLERELAEANALLTYLRSTRAGEVSERLYKLSQEQAHEREELRLRHEAVSRLERELEYVMVERDAALDLNDVNNTTHVTHTLQLVRQAIFHVLDAGRRDGLAWDFNNDEERVDFADAVQAWIVK